MKTLIGSLVLLVFLSSCGGFAADRADLLARALNDESSKNVIVVAHRGCWKETAENSLSSIRRCIDLQVDMVELDVRKTKDGVLVLMHDASVDRTTHGAGLVSDLKYQDIASLVLRKGKGGDDEQLFSETVPSLQQALLISKDNILVNIDAKEDVIIDAISLAQKLGMSDQVIIKAELKANDPKLHQYIKLVGEGFFMPKITQADKPLSEEANTFSQFAPVAIEVKARSEEYIFEGASQIEELGARFWINTLSESPEKAAGHVDNVAVSDPAKHWGKLIELGVDIIQTDEPELLIDYLKEANHRP